MKGTIVCIRCGNRHTTDPSGLCAADAASSKELGLVSGAASVVRPVLTDCALCAEHSYRAR